MAAGLGVGKIASMIAAMADPNGFLDKTLSAKLEGLGEDFLMRYLAGPFGVVGSSERIANAISSGGMSEFQQLGQEWLSAAIPHAGPHLAFLDKMQTMFKQVGLTGGHYGKSKWAYSRQDWLDNKWRHDWRSQPRNALGEWIPGRLDHIAQALKWRGKKTGRKVHHRQDMRRMARLRGRRAARRMLGKLAKKRKYAG